MMTRRTITLIEGAPVLHYCHLHQQRKRVLFLHSKKGSFPLHSVYLEVSLRKNDAGIIQGSPLIRLVPVVTTDVCHN